MTTALQARPDAVILADMREIAAVLRDVAATAGLPNKDPRRRAVLVRKRDLLERVVGDESA